MLLSYPGLIQEFNCNITGVIHVGGHNGEEFAEYSGLENLMVFEPMDFSFKQLKKSAAANNLSHAILINKALGASRGTVTMNSDPTGLCASVLKPKLHLEFSPDVKFTVNQDVEMSTLDDEVPQDHSYNFLNMDVQGYELEVLKGGEKTLEKIQYVYTEVNRDESYENCAMIEELDEFLGARGFSRVKEAWKGCWGDAFYLRG